MPHKLLYISYNGLREPLVESQVLGYLRPLASKGYQFLLLTFEQQQHAAEDIARWRSELAEQGIEWHSVAYRAGANPLSVGLNLIRGLVAIRRLAGDAELIHARAFMPALMAMLANYPRRIPLIFDIRGFWFDEKVDRGSLSHRSPVYRLAINLERFTYRRSAAIVSLTQAAVGPIKSALGHKRASHIPVVVIPTCVDLDRFSPGSAPHDPDLWLGYLGSLGNGYCPEELFRYLGQVRDVFENAKLLIISRTDPEKVDSFRKRAGIPRSAVELVCATPTEVPVLLRRVNVGLSFYRPHFARLATCPTKLGEYLAAGLPVIVNAGVGDVEAIVAGHGVGQVLEDYSPEEMVRSVKSLHGILNDPDMSVRCLAAARQHFDRVSGVEAYATLYAQLLADE